MVALADWQGLIGVRQDRPDVRATLILDSGRPTMCSPFRVEADDGAEYFVKCAEGHPIVGSFALAVEFVVAGVGQLIGAPVAESKIIEIPASLAGWALCEGDGAIVQPGVAHASRAVDVTADEATAELLYRQKDDNRRRHAGIHALYDWCYGEDPQWIYDSQSQLSTFTFDHDQWLQPELPGTGQTLLSVLDDPHPIPGPTAGLAPKALAHFATALEGVTRGQLVGVMAAVPSSWGVTTAHLEMIGFFLEHRAPAVADRLRAMI